MRDVPPISRMAASSRSGHRSRHRSRLGILPQAIDDTLYDAFGQRQVSTIFTQLNQYHVVLEVDPQFQQNPDSTSRSIYVNVRRTGSTGAACQPFSHFETDEHPARRSITRDNFRWSRFVQSGAGVSLGEATKAIAQAEQDIDLPASIHTSFQGTAAAFQNSLSSEPWLILAAIVTVYIVLGVLYESYIHPITILSTLPSAGVGAILALLLTGNDLGWSR